MGSLLVWAIVSARLVGHTRTRGVGAGSLKVAATVLVVLGVASCTGFATPSRSSTPIVFNEPLPEDPGPDVGGRALQQEVFADGKVTADEYERAMVAMVQCMREEGFDVLGPLRYPEGPLAISPGIDPRHRLGVLARDVPAAEEGRWSEVSGRCQAQWSYAIEQVYLRQFNPTQDEIRAWLERAWACSKEKGLPLSNPPTEREAMNSISYGCRPWEASE